MGIRLHMQICLFSVQHHNSSFTGFYIMAREIYSSVHLEEYIFQSKLLGYMVLRVSKSSMCERKAFKKHCKMHSCRLLKLIKIKRILFLN